MPVFTKSVLLTLLVRLLAALADASCCDAKTYKLILKVDKPVPIFNRPWKGDFTSSIMMWHVTLLTADVQRRLLQTSQFWFNNGLHLNTNSITKARMNNTIFRYPPLPSKCRQSVHLLKSIQETWRGICWQNQLTLHWSSLEQTRLAMLFHYSIITFTFLSNAVSLITKDLHTEMHWNLIKQEY